MARPDQTEPQSSSGRAGLGVVALPFFPSPASEPGRSEQLNQPLNANEVGPGAVACRLDTAAGTAAADEADGRGVRFA